MKIILFLIVGICLYAIQLGHFATKNINYKEKLIDEMFITKEVDTKIKKECEDFNTTTVVLKGYIAKRFIAKDTLVCTKDIELNDKKSVVFDFGNFEIEQQGKVIFENDEFIRIKKNDGSIEKIYKDGRIK